MDRRSFLKSSATGALSALALSAFPDIPTEAAPREVHSESIVEPTLYDVVVCGGGPSGVMAAIAASRLGAKVALIEQYGMLGGMATMGFVAPISEFFFHGKQVIGGIPWEFIKRLEAMGGAHIEMPKGNVSFDIELYKLCMQRMILEAKVDLYLHSFLSACQRSGNTVNSAVVNNKSGRIEIRGKMFIDCTGDADLCHMMGVPMQPNDGAWQPSSFCFVISGVDTSTQMMQDAIHHTGKVPRAQCWPVREKLLELKKQGVDMPDFGGPWFNDICHPDAVVVNMTRASVDSTDNKNFTQTECQLREDIFKFHSILKENVPEFRNSYVSSTAPQAGVRESRRILGAYTIPVEEYVEAKHYDDSISRGAHPIDIHATKGTNQVLKSLKSSPYVPFRSLITNDYPNLLVAGRCLSCDRPTLASLRVQASCMGLGQAAGAAAALCAGKGVKVQQTDISKLISTLKTWGAFL